MKIRINKEPPLPLVRIVDEEAKGISTIETVLFDTFYTEECVPAGFCPKEGLILIDLGHCLMSPYFLQQGMMMYPGIWFNMLWSLHHEIFHAKQLEADPSLIEWEGLPPVLEGEAEQYAAIKVMGWCNNGGWIPGIEEMGWCGEQFKALINAHYHDEFGDKLIRQMNAIGMGGIAELRDVVALKDMSIDRYETLVKSAMTDEIGIVDHKNHEIYLRPAEFFGSSFCCMGRDGAQAIYEKPQVRLETVSMGGAV